MKPGFTPIDPLDCVIEFPTMTLSIDPRNGAAPQSSHCVGWQVGLVGSTRRDT